MSSAMNKARFEGRRVKLGEIGKTKSGGTPSSKRPEFFCGDIPWIGTTALNGGLIGRDDAVKLITEEAVRESSTKLIPAGSILVGIRVGVGKAAINVVPMCTSQDVVSIVGINESWWDKRYILLALQYGAPLLAMRAQGATITGITSKTLKEMEVPLRPIEEQKAIAALLTGIKSLIQRESRFLSKLDDLRKSRFIEMFGDPESNTKNWQIKLLGEVCDTRLGKMLDKKKQTGTNLYPYLANANVQWFHFDLANLNVMDFDESDRAEYRLREGDVLATEGGDVGRCAIWHCEIEECFFQKAIHRIRCHRDVLIPDYFVWAFKMKADLGLFEPYTSQSTIAHLTGKKIKQVPIQIPPLSLQREFAAFVRQVDKLEFRCTGTPDEGDNAVR